MMHRQDSLRETESCAWRREGRVTAQVFSLQSSREVIGEVSRLITAFGFHPMGALSQERKLDTAYGDFEHSHRSPLGGMLSQLVVRVIRTVLESHTGSSRVGLGSMEVTQNALAMGRTIRKIK